VRVAERPRGYNIRQTTPHHAGGGVLLEKNTWVYIGRRGAETARKAGGRKWREKLAGKIGREKWAGKRKKKMDAKPTVPLGIG
jgi:hypothetical protein